MECHQCHRVKSYAQRSVLSCFQGCRGRGPAWRSHDLIQSGQWALRFRKRPHIVRSALMGFQQRLHGVGASRNGLAKKNLRLTLLLLALNRSDWYFGIRSTVPSVIAGLDISMPGGDLANFGFEDFYGASALQAAIDA